METKVQSVPADSSSETKFQIIDADIHPRMNALSQLHPYMDEHWRRRMGVKPISDAKDHNTARNVFTNPKRWYYHPHGAERPDALPSGGGRPGSDLATLQKDHLDAYGITHGILIAGDLFGLGGLPDADMAAALASANNDWILNEWCANEPRLKLAMMVGPRDASLAAKEIERIGGNPSVVQVQIPEMDELLGNRRFNPIYEAAESFGLPVAMHGAGESAGVNTPMSPVGIPSYYIEVHTGTPAIAQSHLISLIAEGVFERFPKLKFIFQEMGYAWMPSLMWRFDQEWRSLRAEVPWLKRSPGEYMLEHVRFTSQPIAEPPTAKQHLQLLEMMHADKTLLFASDYPHWDFDNPRHVFREAPEELRRRIYYGNAEEIYRFG